MDETQPQWPAKQRCCPPSCICEPGSGHPVPCVTLASRQDAIRTRAWNPYPIRLQQPQCCSPYDHSPPFPCICLNAVRANFIPDEGRVNNCPMTKACVIWEIEHIEALRTSATAGDFRFLWNNPSFSMLSIEMKFNCVTTFAARAADSFHRVTPGTNLTNV